MLLREVWDWAPTATPVVARCRCTTRSQLCDLGYPVPRDIRREQTVAQAVKLQCLSSDSLAVPDASLVRTCADGRMEEEQVIG